jgi:hypothetical protein
VYQAKAQKESCCHSLDSRGEHAQEFAGNVAFIPYLLKNRKLNGR